MNIKSASEKTGLTKKAIKYYESEGLITPSKNSENNYREYTDADIVKLNLIGALRAVDIPIFNIKEIINGNSTIPKIMKTTLQKIEEKIEHLEKSKLIINSIIENSSKDYESIGEQIKRLKETLGLSVDEKKEYISNALLRLFPGNFGETFVTTYSPFLQVTIDNDEKRKIWLELVEFLDNLDEIDENHPFVKQLNESAKLQNQNTEPYKNKHFQMIKNLLNNDPTTREQIRNQMIFFAEQLHENDVFRKSFKDNLSKSKDLFNSINLYDNYFDDCLAVLSEDYKKYREINAEIKKEADQEIKERFGVDFNELMKELCSN